MILTVASRTTMNVQQQRSPRVRRSAQPDHRVRLARPLPAVTLLDANQQQPPGPAQSHQHLARLSSMPIDGTRRVHLTHTKYPSPSAYSLTSVALATSAPCQIHQPRPPPQRHRPLQSRRLLPTPARYDWILGMFLVSILTVTAILRVATLCTVLEL